MDDPRFQRFLKDPRSRNIPKNVRKIKVDKRFQNMFNTKQFKDGNILDERGRKLDLASSENLKKLYNVVSDSSEDDDNKSNKDTAEPASLEPECKKISIKKKLKEKKSKISQETEHYEKVKDTVVNQRDKKKIFERHEVLKKPTNVSEEDTDNSDKEESEASDSEESGDTDSEEESGISDFDDDAISEKKGVFDHHWEELHEEAPDTDEISRRLAVCNMDWDRIRADDLFAAFNSFKPPDSVVHSVKIYPSEFGAKRMEEEKLNGPSELIEETLDPDEEEVEDKKGSKYHIEKLRQYQINRLRYYYAVVECDTPETANSLYEQLNGMEYESSSVRLDLRFIPDDVIFDQEPSSVTEKMPDPTEYKPRLFVTTALQQVKVNLTWDETDPKRRETLQKAFTEPESIERDIKDYLASSSGESEVEQDDEDENGEKMSTQERIAKYKQLLQSLEDKEKKEEEKYEMEITWEPGLKEKTEKAVKQKLEETENPFEEMLKKKKEDRKLKKQGKKPALIEDEDDNSSAPEASDSDILSESNTSKMTEGKDTKKLGELYLLSDSRKVLEEPLPKSSKRKKNKKPKIEKINEFKCNVMDPRFSAIYSAHEYNIDPSDPHFKKTEGTLAIIQEKQNRLKNKETPPSERKRNKKAKYM